MFVYYCITKLITMEIILIVILAVLAVYFYTRAKKLKNEIKNKDLKINDLTRIINQFQSEILKYQTENSSLKTNLQSAKKDLSYIQITNRELKDKIAELSKYQNIIDVKIECEYLLKKSAKRLRKAERKR